MNVSLIEKIKGLIAEATVSAGELFSDFSDGGIHIVHQDTPPLDKDEYLDPEEVKAHDARRAAFDRLNRYRIKNTGVGGKIKKYVFTYEGKKDTRNWVPRLVTFSTKKIQNYKGNPFEINVTVQTKKFLEKLLNNLLGTEIDDVTSTEKPKISNIEVTFEENEYERTEFKEITNNLKRNFFDGIDKIYRIILEDPRFRPASYKIHITAPIEKYSDEDINQIKAMYDETTFATDAATVKASINNQKINIDIFITQEVTLLPLYNKLNYVPTNSKVGALDKLAWTYQQLREINKSTTSNIVSYLDGLIDSWKKQLSDIAKIGSSKKNTDRINKLKQNIKDANALIKKTKMGDLTYIEQQTFDTTSNEDAMAIGPIGLLAKARRITDKSESNSIIVITSDVGRGYLWIPDITGKNNDYLQTFDITNPKSGKDTKIGKLIKDYFEGLIPKEAFLLEIKNQNFTGDQKNKIDRFIKTYIERTYFNVYCMKMMFSDQVNIQYNMRLPQSVLDNGPKITRLPKNVRVPGSERLPEKTTESVLKTAIDIDKKPVTSLITMSPNILNKGSGSLGFFNDSIRFSTGDFGNGRIKEFITNIMYMVSATENVIYNFYTPITKKQFDELKGGNSVVVEQNGKQITLDPNTNTALASIMNSMDEYKKSTALVLKYDKVGFTEAKQSLTVLKKIFRNMLRQFDSVGWNMSQDIRKKLNDIINSYNSSISGSPGLITKIQNDAMVGIGGSKGLKQNISDVIVSNNILIDAMPLINAYFKSLVAEKKNGEVNGDDDAFIPSLVNSGTLDGFNFGSARKGVHIDARATLVKQLYDFLTKGRKKIIEIVIRKTTDANDFIKKNLDVIRYLDDTIKLLEKITTYDGVRMFEFKDIENIENLATGTLSVINTGLTAMDMLRLNENFKIESLPSIDVHGDNPMPAIKDAVDTSKESDIDTGVAISESCKKEFAPLVGLLKRMISKVEVKDKRPIAILSNDAAVPYAPVHTIISLAHNDKNIMLIVLSSRLKIDENKTSYYDYQFNEKTSKFSVGDTTKIADEDKDMVQTAMGQMDFAFCSFNMMSTKRMLAYTSSALDHIQKRATDGYRKLRLIARKILIEINNNSTLTEAEKAQILAISDPNNKKSLKDIITDIVKYICVSAILLEIQNNNDMEF